MAQTEFMRRLAECVPRARVLQNWDDAALSTHCGIGVAELQQLERGELVAVDAEAAVRLAQHAGQNLHLLAGFDSAPSAQAEEAALDSSLRLAQRVDEVVSELSLTVAEIQTDEPLADLEQVGAPVLAGLEDAYAEAQRRLELDELLAKVSEN